METHKDRERQLAHRTASNPALNFPTRRKLKEKKDKELEKIIRNFEKIWNV